MQVQKIARERIIILFEEARKKFEEDPNLSNRYVEIANRIGEKTQTPIPQRFNKSYCSKCESYWNLGINCDVVFNRKKRKIDYKCQECGEVNTYAY